MFLDAPAKSFNFQSADFVPGTKTVYFSIDYRFCLKPFCLKPQFFEIRRLNVLKTYHVLCAFKRACDAFGNGFKTPLNSCCFFGFHGKKVSVGVRSDPIRSRPKNLKSVIGRDPENFSGRDLEIFQKIYQDTQLDESNLKFSIGSRPKKFQPGRLIPVATVFGSRT
jgi:hypothetical protein